VQDIPDFIPFLKKITVISVVLPYLTWIHSWSQTNYHHCTAVFSLRACFQETTFRIETFLDLSYWESGVIVEVVFLLLWLIMLLWACSRNTERKASWQWMWLE